MRTDPAHKDAVTAGTPPTSAQWERVLGRLRAEYGDAVFKSWLKPLTFAKSAEVDPSFYQTIIDARKSVIGG